MKKISLLVFAGILLFLLITCKKSSQSIFTNEEQPITVSLEIDGKQSQEVRIK